MTLTKKWQEETLIKVKIQKKGKYNMLELKPFNRNILKEVSYYAALDYIADYIQAFLKEVFGNNIELPINVDVILEKLGINIELINENLKYISSLHYTCKNGQINNTKIFLNKDAIHHPYLDFWPKLECLAQYILISGFASDNHNLSFSNGLLTIPFS